MITAQQYRSAIGSFSSTTSCNREPKQQHECDNKSKNILILSIIIVAAIGGILAHTNKVHLSHKQQNKLVHIQEGNKNIKGYKLSQWNCGSAYLENKMAEVEAAVARVKPTVFCVSESNLRTTVDQAKVQIPGYRLLTSKTITNLSLNISRVVVYLDSNVKGKLREDLMDSSFSSIWIELGSGDKPLLIGCVYREHQYMKQADNSSLSHENQVLRWNIFIQQWKAALASGAEVHTLGDFNIDSKAFHKSVGNYGELIKMVKENIISQGVTQCVKSPTRWPQGLQAGIPVTIDHHWTTAPEKLSEVSLMHMGSSDHALVSVVRYSRCVKSSQQYVTKRSYKNFNNERFLDEVGLIHWWDVYKCTTVDEAVRLFTERVCGILDRNDMAPVKTFQQRRQYAPWLSAETKSLMEERDKAMKRARVTKTPEDIEKASMIRKRCTRILRTEKHRYLKGKLDKCENEKDVSGIWKNVRSFLGWGNSGGSPTELTDPHTGQQTNSPKIMTNIQNQYYADKVRKIREKLPKTGDPTKTLRTLINKRPHPRQEGLTLKAVCPREIDQIIRQLKKLKKLWLR